MRLLRSPTRAALPALFSDMYSASAYPSKARVFALLAWTSSVFSLIAILLINFGGVSFPLPSGDSPVTRLGNPGFELLSWFFDGDPRDTSIANFYHYRLTLNRVCAVNPTRQRGVGNCFNAGPLGAFYLSQHTPDAFVASDNSYDAVVGAIDFRTPFVFYIFSAIAAAGAVLIIPCTLLTDSGKGSLKRWQVVARTRSAHCLFAAALNLTLASSSLTFAVFWLAKWMQYVPQVTRIWVGDAPLAMTWTATALSIISAVALFDDARTAKRVWREQAAWRRPCRWRSEDSTRSGLSPVGLGMSDADVEEACDRFDERFDEDSGYGDDEGGGGDRRWWEGEKRRSAEAKRLA